MRRLSITLLAAFLAAGCGGNADTTTLQQKQDAQIAEQKQADDDEMRSRKESDATSKKAKK